MSFLSQYALPALLSQTPVPCSMPINMNPCHRAVIPCLNPSLADLPRSVVPRLFSYTCTTPKNAEIAILCLAGQTLT